jgi:catechol 2,3-dioxygenase-like lactoylglutathione lyase family enzyme
MTRQEESMAEQRSATTPILGLAEAMPTIAVRKIDTARRFYEGVLDLEVVHHDSELAVYKGGRSTILVYESQFAGTNEATAMTWVVGNELDQIVAALKARGVAFEHYDLPDTTRQGDIHVSGDVRIAWFKDPDGNIMALSKN